VDHAVKILVVQSYMQVIALRFWQARVRESARRSTSEIADCALNHTQSFKHEDLVLLPSLYALTLERGSGTFVEIGAFDGVTGSNTFMIEKCLGWRGVLIEANPGNYMKARTAGRMSPVVHSAVCDQEKGATATISVAGEQTSGLIHRLTTYRQLARKNSTVQVPCQPLKNLLAKHGFGSDAQIDFLSLDVEGAEDIVLRTAVANRFRIVLVETVPGPSVKMTRKILEGNGLHRASNQLYPLSIHAMNDVWLQSSTREFPISGMIYHRADLFFASSQKPQVPRDALLAALQVADRSTAVGFLPVSPRVVPALS